MQNSRLNKHAFWWLIDLQWYSKNKNDILAHKRLEFDVILIKVVFTPVPNVCRGHFQ